MGVIMCREHLVVIVGLKPANNNLLARKFIQMQLVCYGSN